jgi:hypothetical protein
MMGPNRFQNELSNGLASPTSQLSANVSFQVSILLPTAHKISAVWFHSEGNMSNLMGSYLSYPRSPPEAAHQTPASESRTLLGECGEGCTKSRIDPFFEMQVSTARN